MHLVNQGYGFMRHEHKLNETCSFDQNIHTSAHEWGVFPQIINLKTIEISRLGQGFI